MNKNRCSALKILIPQPVKSILFELNNNGFQAYIVGGCVRDFLVGKEPHDWDICTSALPNEIIEVFKDEKVILTGEKHGTVTVAIDDGQYEITTFRVDGDYEDNRRPTSVTFTTSIYQDLARRDFTMNAIAYDPHSDTNGFIDPYNGIIDIENKTICCVGNASDRFQEDGLRILRGLRFSAQFGFSIDGSTEIAIKENYRLLDNISKERINSELCKILMSKNCGNQVLRKYPKVVQQIIPQLKPTMGFKQNNPYHSYDVWEHTLHCMDYESKTELEADLIVRIAILLHDIGKPNCYSEDEHGGHFYQHPAESARIASVVLSDLKFSNDIKNKVVELIKHHGDTFVPQKKYIKRMLNKLGEEQLRRLLLMREFDLEGHNQENISCVEQKDGIKAICSLFDEIIGENECFKIKDLKVNGRDLLEIGVPESPAIGFWLKRLLILVIDGDVENNKQDLLDYIKLQYSMAKEAKEMKKFYTTQWEA